MNDEAPDRRLHDRSTTPPGAAAAIATPALWALVVVTGVGPFAVDTYLGALPDVSRDLEVTAGVAQLSVTLFIVGVATGQLVFGPISDGRGRRPLLLRGTAVFTVATFVCAATPSGVILVGARLVEGLAAGCCVAVGRATIGDSASGVDAARRIGTLAAIIFLAPVVAPSVGGLILLAGSWRTVFLVLTVFGLVMIAAAVWGIPETLPAHRRGGSGLGQSARRMAGLVRDWTYFRHVAVLALATAGTFTYVGGSSFVLETVYGLTPSQFAAVFAVNAGAMAASSWLFRGLVGRVTVRGLRLAGLAAAALAAVVLAVAASTMRDPAPPLALVWAALFVVNAGIGWVAPASMALALEAGSRARGAAAALLGGVPFFVGALATPLTGVLGYSSVLPLGLLMAAFLSSSLVLLLGSSRGTDRGP